MNVLIEEVLNFDEISKLIQNQLDFLINNSLCNENPKIYHLDVGAMYPNIILTNRLQVFILQLLFLFFFLASFCCNRRRLFSLYF